MNKNLIIRLSVVLGITVLSAGCKKFLDVNNNPAVPQFPDPSAVLPTQLAAIPRGLQYDARYAGRFIQNWAARDANTATSNNIERMGFTAASDANGDIWRQCYFGLGKNLDYMIEKGLENKQLDYVGVAYALKAMMFQYATDYHGEIIFKEAFRQDQTAFRYDDQETVYKGVDSLARIAIRYLSDTSVNTTAIGLAKGDYVYNGNKSRWLKFTYGILARNFHRITNKATYQPDSVIYYCDKSMADNNDDFLIPFDATRNDDANFFGTYRDNLTTYRQTNYIVKLLDGTTLTGIAASTTNGYNRDPRMRHMLSASQDTTNGNGGFRGVDPSTGDGLYSTTTGANARKRVAVPWADSVYNNPMASVFSTQYRKYLFGDKQVFPVMTASEIQFMKSEAAFRKGDINTAYTAYKNGINYHFDFINRPTFPRGNMNLYNVTQITATERANYLASANVKQNAAALTLTDIMLQKYISLWGWGFFETFVDMRRYHWTDLDPITGAQVYKGFVLPTLSGENLGKPVYRVRPRYNSEYVWNRDELLRIGALNIDYHTYECWFSQP